MPQNEFIRSILNVSDSLAELQRSRTILDAYRDRLEGLSMKGLPDETVEELENIWFLIDTYDSVSLKCLRELTESITESMRVIERMRQNGKFNNRHQ